MSVRLSEAVAPSPLVNVQGTDAVASPSPMPPELKTEVRRLLAKILVNDFLNDRTDAAADTSEETP